MALSTWPRNREIIEKAKGKKEEKYLAMAASSLKRCDFRRMGRDTEALLSINAVFIPKINSGPIPAATAPLAAAILKVAPVSKFASSPS